MSTVYFLTYMSVILEEIEDKENNFHSMTADKVYIKTQFPSSLNSVDKKSVEKQHWISICIVFSLWLSNLMGSYLKEGGTICYLIVF